MSDSLKLTKEAIEKAAEVAKAIMPQGDGNPISIDEPKEWKPLFEPAKPDELPPENIWIPNRRERRAMKKHGNKMEKAMSKFYQEAINDARDYVNTPDYKNEIYKALYEKTKARNEELEKEIANLNGTATVEGNEVLEG
jgi:hypothetical protein